MRRTSTRVLYVLLPLLLVGVVLWSLVQHRKRLARHPLYAPTARELRAAFTPEQRHILEEAPELILYAIEPESMPPLPHLEYWQDYPVVGKVALTDSAQKQQLLTALYSSFAEEAYRRATGRASFLASCFLPHHGIRAVAQGKTLDLVICFSCGHLEIYLDENEVQWCNIGEWPAFHFDQILEENGVIRPTRGAG